MERRGGGPAAVGGYRDLEGAELFAARGEVEDNGLGVGEVEAELVAGVGAAFAVVGASAKAGVEEVGEGAGEEEDEEDAREKEQERD